MPHGRKLAVVVAGGPAPGINGVVGAATFHAASRGIDVLGIEQGFEHVMRGDTSRVVPLTIAGTSRVHLRGGSCIGISRANPTKRPEDMRSVLASLERLGVGMLVTIGGDDTAYTAFELAELAARGDGGARLRVVHVPKTIDNDLDLPDDVRTFGYETARAVGAGVVRDLMTDAETTGRWYFVVAMGRKAGHLALGIGKAAGATLTLLPEEHRGARVRLATIVDTLAGAVIKRLARGRPDGVAVLAEGLAEIVPPDDLADLATAERDDHGNLRLDEIAFGDVCKARVRDRLRALGVRATIVAKNVGYELRCADPVPLDVEYTRDLGYFAARHVIEGGTSALASIRRGRFEAVPLASLIDPVTKRMRVRMVDVDGDRYRAARAYMLRLERSDLDDPAELAGLAAVTRLPPERLREELGRAAGVGP